MNYNIHHEYTAPRALGMGDTFSAINDYNVLFYNPAGLANLEQKDFNFGVGGGTSKDTLDFQKEIKNISDSGASDSDKINNMTNLLQSKYGKMFSARLPKLSFIYTRPNWGFGLVPVDLSAAMIPSYGPALDVTAYQDTTLIAGYARRTKDKKFSWGFAAKAIYRGNFDKSLLGVDLVQNKKVLKDEDFKEGLTVDADAGVQYRPWLDAGNGFFRRLNPTFALVVRNIFDVGFFGNYKFYNKNASVKPEKLHRRVDVGSAWDLLPSNRYIQARFALDIRDILHDNFSLKKGFHTGAELLYNLGYALNGSLQAGFMQGYWTGGLGLQTLFMKFEVVSYAEEYGTKNNKLTDRQYAAQFNLNF